MSGRRPSDAALAEAAELLAQMELRLAEADAGISPLAA